ncbi:hypothetical protein CKO15_11535 [Halorhodospira abdelmalekii]|uniref:hypothetical protein n=1 Tax=Halorhodospira abdelmalekii TaxID=421629 RepID=UPI00190383CD|nr:hypothetical protein [Halorhodospira abdelmalekii]MBK1735897.1 hypothetical protein [Halorhodospira abdelmalekii]
MGSNRKPQWARQAFAERLAQAISASGLSLREQSRLGRRFGVTGPAVRKWLDASAMPSRENMQNVARELGVCQAWLEYGEGPMHPQCVIGETNEPPAADYRSDPLELREEELRIVLTWRRLSDEDRVALMHIAERLAEGSHR